MTAITFPNSPSSGDTHTAGNGIVYTYDGEKWTSIGTNSAGTWTRSGTEVSLTNAGDDLNVDSGTLFVDASTDRVGVGTSSPSQQLHVTSAGNTTALIAGGGTGYAQLKLTGGSTANYVDSDDPLQLSIGGTTRATLTSTGLGIGTTSPPQKLSVHSGTTTDGRIEAHGIIARDNWGSASGLGNGMFSSASNTLSFATNSTERMRIDSSGRLLVGTSTSLSANALFQVSGNANIAEFFTARTDFYGPNVGLNKSRGSNASPAAVSSGDHIGTLECRGYDGSNYVLGAHIRGEVDGTPGTNDMPGRLVFSTTADGASSPTERMRITNGGKIYANTTADPVGPSDVIIHAARTNGNAIGATVTTAGYTCYTVSSVTNGYAMWVWNTTTSANVGSILVNTASVSYTTTSDYRLKENVTPINEGITRLQQLKPSRFNFIADPDTTVDGFLAHEVQDIVPEAITGDKDAVDDEGNPVYQGIDQSKLVPLLTAALQEAIGEIESLKARVAALEAS